MYSNTSGTNNTAFGAQALYSNTNGFGNAAQGVNALLANTSGYRNVAIGNGAMQAETTGTNNIALGWASGTLLVNGSNNIYIGSPGGSSGESNTIRIGALGTQTSAYIQGISGTQLTGSAVYVNSMGQLGVLASSERFKTNVASMGAATGKLDLLRPVTFTLKSDPQAVVQYGLIAEEVAAVYPELVLHDADGQISGVRYEELAPMLLNEVQQQRREIADQRASFAAQAREIQEMRRQLAELNELAQAAKAAQVKLQAAQACGEEL
jgi:hypothetical protein